MLNIGDFSKLSRISIRMLRHYDEIGLLVPKEVDAFSGYQGSYGQITRVNEAVARMSWSQRCAIR